MILHEAVVAIATLQEELAVARAEAAASRARTMKALELAQEFLSYVPEYFRQKWKFDEQFRALAKDVETA